MQNLTLAELFAGVGGWSVAAKMAGGITPIYRSEIHPYKNKIYDLRFPGVPNGGDITTITNAPYADIYTVSFPCTDISASGKGEGIEGKNSRLWFEAERIIRLVRPRYIAIENSPILTIRGLHRILEFFASIGYNAEWCCLRGDQFGIQQLRKRIYIIAYARKIGKQCPQIPVFRTISERPKSRRRTEFLRVFPGWRDRRDLPQPRNYRSANDLPNLVHRHECMGDAIIPVIGMYLLECIKIHNQEYHE